jgi:uncharacterized membrane-anchored protein
MGGVVTEIASRTALTRTSLLRKRRSRRRSGGEARDHLHKAEKVVADTRVFKLRAEIEKRAFQDNSEALMWMKKAETAPEPRTWVCRATGRIYDTWHAIAEPHGSFNTIIWDFPGMPGEAAVPLHIGAADALIEAPLIFRPKA